MRIAIDISQVVYETGVSTYTRNLVHWLLKIDKNNSYLLFAGTLRRRKDIDKYVSTLEGNFKFRILPMFPTLADIIWNKFHLLKIESLLGKIDVLHSSDWTQPPSKAQKVTTIHDLVPIKYPKLSHPKIVSVHKRRFKWVKNEVDSIIVPSETTRDDLVKLGISKDRIVAIPEAPGPVFKPASKNKISKIKRKYRISRKYLISIGIAPRKNTERIIDAFEKVRAGEGLSLVLVGEPKLEISERRGVKIIGHVPLEDLPSLYSGSEALVYPSLYEGFGLPILEAFSCKTPVVTSNIGSMKEVSGNAAVLVDPYSVDSLRWGLEKVLNNQKKYVERGTERAKRYSWEKNARETLKVYEKFQK